MTPDPSPIASIMKLDHFHKFSPDTQVEYEVRNCHCGVKDSYRHIGPYCKRWSQHEDIKDKGPWCLLKGGWEARFCAGAIKFINLSMYYTNDSTICNKSETGMYNLINIKFRLDLRAL